MKTITENFVMANSELVIKRPVSAVLCVEVTEEDEKDSIRCSGGYHGNGKNALSALKHAVKAIAGSMIESGMSEEEALVHFGMVVESGLREAVERSGKTPTKLSSEKLLDVALNMLLEKRLEH
jgi:hypothetical protein